MKAENNIAQIESYLQGKLSEEEQIIFENKLDSDHSFKEQFNDYVTAIESVTDQGLREDLDRIYNEKVAGRQVRFTDKWKYLTGIAATILIVSVFYVFRPDTTSTDQLFRKYFSPYPNLSSTRSNEQNDYTLLLEHYSSGRYSDVISQFENIDKRPEDHVLFYVGISYLAVDHSDRALEVLSALTSDKFKQQTTWYLALVHLQKGDSELAEQKLTQIEPDDFNYGLAREILDSIE
ncbi:MAG: hypothetical protein RIM99_08030 [Cyclobacteriaceae bacterium]